MFSASIISVVEPRLIQAYRDTDYQVDAAPPFVLQIGVPSTPLTQLFRLHKCDCAAFVTACNPKSQGQSQEINDKRQSELARDLNARSLTFITGLGQHREGKWPGECSFLVLGLSLEASRALGRRYDQNALVWCGGDAIPQLILLR